MDVYHLKFGTWKISDYDPLDHAQLCAAGYSPLTAAVLCSRGYARPEAARQYLAADAPLCDPFEMRDMDKAAARVYEALEQGQHIAVFGDYDVDGITATCLLTDFLRSEGGWVTPYIPSRLEEGYGLNPLALETLREEGVELIVTVDCGITADREAELCREMGMELVITDHHECKDVLPCACAVVDPHRKDHTYPHQLLAGVGVAFKLACAISGDAEAMLERYAHLVCLGTVADVMPLRGENRTMVARGLAKLAKEPGIGLTALMEECGCAGQIMTANLIGYTLAPRINAAGRIGRVSVAVDLFLTEDPEEAKELAEELCRMNRQRQSIEAEIYEDAVNRLPCENPDAIVLSGEDWHQGVVGIVASRLAEEYCCPTFLICMDGDKGKASSRSYGGFNLFRTLDELSPLLESYGGHELAAGFTIQRSKIEEFCRAMELRARTFRESGLSGAALEIDCSIAPELLTLRNIDALEELEPCGAGCPKPIFSMSGVQVVQLTAVGSGKHLRMRLRKNGREFSGIFFSATEVTASVAEGDIIEIAFAPQANEFRGIRSVQLNLVDLRQSREFRQRAEEDLQLYSRLSDRLPVSREELDGALPQRKEFVAVWKYLSVHAREGRVEDSVECLSRKIARAAGLDCSPLRLKICLDVFEELGLLALTSRTKSTVITLADRGRKVDLEDSRILNELRDKQAEGY